MKAFLTAEDQLLIQGKDQNTDSPSQFGFSVPRSRDAEMRNLVVNCDQKTKLILANSTKDELCETSAGLPFLVPLWILGPHGAAAEKSSKSRDLSSNRIGAKF